MKLKIFLAAIFSFFVAAESKAVTLDFGDPGFQVAALTTNNVTWNAGNIDVTVSAAGGILPFLDWSAGGGYGVNQFLNLLEDPDELNVPESISVTFSAPVLLQGISISKLFPETNILGSAYTEKGYYSLDGNAPVLFSAISNSGLLDITIPSLIVQSITFSGYFVLRLEGHEYAVKGVSFAETPEPATMLLLSCALLGGVLTNRFRA
jgi:hypothetical protein